MMRTRILVSTTGILIAGLTGCAQVNPQLDYDRAAELIRDATSVEQVYRPGGEDEANAKLESLLEEGLTADEAVQAALLNNPRLRAEFFKIGVARADLVQSGLLSNPSIGLSTKLPAGGGLLNIEASLAQNITELWQIPVRKRALERSLESTILQIAQQAGALAADVKVSYYETIAADRTVAILTESSKVAEELLELTQTLKQTGAVSGVDVNLARSALQETQLAVRLGQLAAFEARNGLVGLLGLAVHPNELNLIDELPALPEESLNQRALLKIAAENRLDLAAARQAVEALSANVDLEKLRVWPLVEVGLELEREARARGKSDAIVSRTVRSSIDAGRFNIPRPEPEGIGEVEFVIGPSISLEVPLFDQNQAQIAKAEYLYTQGVILLHALALDVVNQTRLACERAIGAWEIGRRYRSELLPLRQKNLELAREAYRSGKVPLISVLQAQRTLQDSRAAYVRSLRDGADGWVELERVTGRPITVIQAALQNSKDEDSEEISQDEE